VDSIRCVIFGSISKLKGYDRAIAVLEKNPNIKLFIAGPLWKTTEKKTLDFLKKKEKTLKNLKVEAREIKEEEFKSYSKDADIILLPYHKITSSAIFCRVAGYMTPIITWDLPFFREYENKYKSFAMVNSVEELEKKIKEISSSKKLRDRFKKNMKIMVEKCSWRKVAEDYLKIYREII
jgi:glycosyltransferase involved in cell wall biosynthesis